MNLNATISASELRKKLSYYLRKAKRGSSICVTLRGQSVAILMPVGNHPGTQIARKLSGMGAVRGRAASPRADRGGFP